jgi:hypothetical protein
VSIIYRVKNSFLSWPSARDAVLGSWRDALADGKVLIGECSVYFFPTTCTVSRYAIVEELEGDLAGVRRRAVDLESLTQGS